MLPGSKRSFAPSPDHFWDLSLVGQFPRSVASQILAELTLVTCTGRRGCNARLGIPPTPGEGLTPPFVPSPSHSLKKGVFGQRILISPVSPCRQDRKLLLPGRVDMRVLGPRNPPFQEWGFGPLSGVGEIPMADPRRTRASALDLVHNL